MNEGDWIEGEPQWWWKYVFPSRERFWGSVLSDRMLKAKFVSEPSPSPWFAGVAAEILEGLVMLHASDTVAAEVSQKLQEEAVGKIMRAAEQVRG